MAGGEGEGTSLEFTPTWVVAAVCTVIVGVSIAVERLLHLAGKKLQKGGRKPLYEALQKVKEELMLLGFISLLLSVCQDRIVKICVNENIMEHFIPCSLDAKIDSTNHKSSTLRNLLEDKETSVGYCALKNKVPLLSLEALHHLHIFIFILAIVHVTFSVLTVVFGGAKISRWKHWEASIREDNFDPSKALEPEFTHAKDHDFIKNRFLGLGKRSAILGWLHSFCKQFYGSVTKSDYAALRLGFITTHCRGNPKFNFHKYMVRALEDDFQKVVGIRYSCCDTFGIVIVVQLFLANIDVTSWYLWASVIVFLLLNVYGWHSYFWIAFIPLILLFSVGTKLEHIIIELAHEVAEKHVAIEGEVAVKPSDDHFWFGRPRIVLLLIHFILFQNAFEIAFFFWILVIFGLDSCIMGKLRYIIPRLVIGVFIQVLCSYSTLPLYALVTQMGSHFKKSIFEERIQTSLTSWAQKAKRKKALNVTTNDSNQDGGGGQGGGGSDGVELQGIQIARDPQQSTNQ